MKNKKRKRKGFDVLIISRGNLFSGFFNQALRDAGIRTTHATLEDYYVAMAVAPKAVVIFATMHESPESVQKIQTMVQEHTPGVHVLTMLHTSASIFKQEFEHIQIQGTALFEDTTETIAHLQKLLN